MATICKRCGGMVPDYGGHACRWAHSHVGTLEADIARLRTQRTRLIERVKTRHALAMALTDHAAAYELALVLRWLDEDQ